jgi:uncharacterized phage-associated protein
MMEKLREVASYISMRYLKEYGKPIDEMKLHKLLYFAQRESLVQQDTPLFREKFEAWKYGPVLVPVRHLYKDELLDTPLTKETIKKYAEVFEKIFSQYAIKDSWSLSALTHGEYSWKHARQGVPDGENCTNEMDIDDIRIDAKRIKMRRFMLSIIKK